MRVLLSSYQCMPDQGSELGNGWHWARALAELGHDVTVLTQPSHIIRAAAPPGITFLHTSGNSSPLTRFSRQLGTTHHYLRWQDAAWEFASEWDQEFDVVHHVSWGSLHLGSLLWQLPVPLVYGPIGGGQTAPGRYWRQFGRNWPQELVRTGVTRQLLRWNPRGRETIRGSAVVLVTNSATADACRRLGAEDVRYMLAEGLPEGWVGAPHHRPDGTPVVLWVGRLLPRKAPLLALEAFAALRRTMRARLVVAGDGPLLDRVREGVSDLGLGPGDVELLGRVPWTEMPELYDSASASLFTSMRDSSGSQFLEALGRGLPAVALNHHGIGDLDVGSAAVKVDLPRRPRDLPGLVASALREVLLDPGWEKRSTDAVRWAAGHSWPAKAAAASAVYHDVVRSTP
jgi:glycosyltransferase involved in cell wall biosynthesis